MKIHIFRVSSVINDLVNNSNSAKDISYYMLANVLFGILAGYSTLVYSNANGGWLGWLEFIILICTTIFGFEKCFSISKSEFFIYDFICLSLPISVTTVFFAWSIHFISWKIYQNTIIKMSFYGPENSDIFLFINNKIPFYSIFFMVIFTNVIYYKRLQWALRKIEYIRSGK